MLIGTERGSYSRPSIVASGMTSWRLRAAEHDGGPQWFQVIHPACINDGAAIPERLSVWSGLSTFAFPVPYNGATWWCGRVVTYLVYQMRISDWSSDVCSSDLEQVGRGGYRY